MRFSTSDCLGAVRLTSLLLIASLPLSPYQAGQRPGAPLHLYAYATSATGALLIWDPPAAKPSPAGYAVYRFAAKIGTARTARYEDTGLSMGAGYSYTIRALDAAGGESAASEAAVVVTPFTTGVLTVGGDTPCVAPATVPAAVEPALTAVRGALPRYLADADRYDALIAPYRKSSALAVASSVNMVELGVRLLRSIPHIVECAPGAFQYAVLPASLESIDAALPYFYGKAQSGADPYAGMKSGTIAVKSVTDSHLDYYQFSLPQNYSPAARYPLEISLHPAASCAWEAGGMAAPVAKPIDTPGGHAASPNAIYMTPCARGPATSYSVMAQITVLDEIADICRRFPVDPNRITVGGASMGGTGAIRLATLYPDRFAGAGLLTGSAAYLLPANDYRYDASLLLANLKNTRFVIWYAVNDTSTYAADDALASAMQALATRFPGFYPFQRHSDPAGSHGVVAGPLLAEGESFLSKGVREPYPPSVHYTTGSEQYDGAYWVHGMLRTDSRQPGSIDVQASGATVSVRTSNLRGFSLDLSPANILFRGRAALSVQVDAMPEPLQAPAGQTVYFNSTGAAWTAGPSAAPGLVKRSGVSGPIADLFMRYPVVMVYGTKKGNTPAHGEAITAELLQASFGQSEGRESSFHYGPFTVKADRDVTADDIASSNLVVFGTPEQNSLMERLADRLPFHILPQGISLAGKTYAGANIGWSVLYPNPLNPSRYVLLASEHGNMSSLSNSGINSHVLQSDYLVVEMVSGLNSRKVVTEGSFDRNWK